MVPAAPTVVAPMPTAVDVTDPEERARVIAYIAGGVALIKEAMGVALVQGTDYGLIPGTQSPSLWQPGAEKIRVMFDLSADTTIVHRHEDWTKGARVFAYSARCVVRNAAGRVLVEQEATCSTEEERYASAHVERERYGKTLRAIDPADQCEIVMLMAQKRAFVAAIRRTSMVSELFTQDDDLVRDAGPRGGREPSKWGICPVHGVEFFQSRNMKRAAHPTGPRDSDAPWCDYDAVLRRFRTEATQLLTGRFPADAADTPGKLREWLQEAEPLIAEIPADSRTAADWAAIAEAAREAPVEDAGDGWGDRPPPPPEEEEPQ